MRYAPSHPWTVTQSCVHFDPALSFVHFRAVDVPRVSDKQSPAQLSPRCFPGVANTAKVRHPFSPAGAAGPGSRPRPAQPGPGHHSSFWHVPLGAPPSATLTISWLPPHPSPHGPQGPSLPHCSFLVSQRMALTHPHSA